VPPCYCAGRLIAKFRLTRDPGFWDAGFDAISQSALYPTGGQFEELCLQIRGELGTEVEPGRLGKFLQEWADLENLILTMARRRGEKVFSLREAVSALSRHQALPSGMRDQLDELRQLRNLAVHEPKRVEPQALAEAFERISALRSEAGKLGS
jgi:hypothetical protein